MAIYHQDIADIELNSGSLHRSFLGHSIGLGDAAANRFGVRVFRDGVAETLSGVTCQGFFRNANGENIALTSYGTIDGNVAYVTLPQACYNVEGVFTLAIKLVGGGVTGTMRIVDGMVDNTNTGSAVAPVGSVPTYQEVLSVYEQMQTTLSNYDAKVTEQDGKIDSLKSAINSLPSSREMTILFDWEKGNINASGEEANNNSGMYARTVGYYQPEYDGTIKITQADGVSNLIVEFDSSGTMTERIGTVIASTPKLYKLKKTHKYRFCFNGDQSVAPLDLNKMQNHMKILVVDAFTNSETTNLIQNNVYSGGGNVPIQWELGAINNSGNEEDNTTMVRTPFYWMKPGDSFECSQTNLRVFYYDKNKNFIKTLYSVTANTPYVMNEYAYIRFRAAYSSGDYDYYNQYLTVYQNSFSILYAQNADVQDTMRDEIVKKVEQAIDGPNLIFVHITDSHVGTGAMTPERGTEHFKRAINLAKAVNADFVIHTGDMIQGNGSITGENDRERYSAYIGNASQYTTPFLWCQGNANHDFGVKTSDNPLTYALNRDIVNTFVGRLGKWQTAKAVYNESDTVHSYYYIDNEYMGYRIIVLDADDYGGLRRGWGFSDTQISWFANALNGAKANDYPVLVFAHMPPLNALMPSGIENSGGSQINDAIKSFTGNGGIILAYIYGHVHWDAYYNDSEHGIKYISCTCDLPEASQETFVPTLGTKTVPSRTIGTNTEYACDVYVIDKNTGNIQTFRYGAGDDRVFS